MCFQAAAMLPAKFSDAYLCFDKSELRAGSAAEQSAAWLFSLFSPF